MRIFWRVAGSAVTARLRGHDGTIGERLEHDLAAFQKPLPAPYDACDKKPGSVNSLSLVRYRTERLLSADGLRAPEGAGPWLRA